MEIEMKPGKYVVAVSGGVDSMVLLDLLRQIPGLQLTVAHFDHGIRPDSAVDKDLVEAVAKSYGLAFISQSAKLGPAASEALARNRRYDFLDQVRLQTKSGAIITAHHQDDLLETAVLNMLRGTGRSGLSSLASRGRLLRPLLSYPKASIVQYAKQHGIKWREDSTNSDEHYLRNYIRRQIIPRFSDAQRQQLLACIHLAATQNRQIDECLGRLLSLHTTENRLERHWFISLPHNVAKEVLRAWLLTYQRRSFDRQWLERAAVLLKTCSHGTLIDVDAETQLKIDKNYLALLYRER